MDLVSPKQSDAICTAALQHPDKNRSMEFLPCKNKNSSYTGTPLQFEFLKLDPIKKKGQVVIPLMNSDIASLFAADKHRVILSGEYPDYIHAVAANVSSLGQVE